MKDFIQVWMQKDPPVIRNASKQVFYSSAEHGKLVGFHKGNVHNCICLHHCFGEDKLLQGMMDVSKLGSDKLILGEIDHGSASRLHGCFYSCVFECRTARVVESIRFAD